MSSAPVPLVRQEGPSKAYAALLGFKDVVKENKGPAAGPGASAAPAKYTSIDAAAQQLTAASYPFRMGFNWPSDFYGKALPGRDAFWRCVRTPSGG